MAAAYEFKQSIEYRCYAALRTSLNQIYKGLVLAHSNSVDFQAQRGLSESEKIKASKCEYKDRNLKQKREASFKEYEQLMKVRIDWNWNKIVVLR
jgi:hypothetical protein